jgi:hypothetical protein
MTGKLMYEEPPVLLSKKTLVDRYVVYPKPDNDDTYIKFSTQGVFPHGIDIIQAANYFSLGNRNQAFLEISIEIAQ